MLSIEVTGQNIANHFTVLYHSVLTILARMPKLKYEKLLYLDEKARIESGRVFGEEAYDNYDDLLALQAKGQKEFTCRYGTYNLMEVLRLMPKQESNHPPPQKNNPWTSGSFYLVAVLAAMGLIGYFNQKSILFVVVGGIFALVGIGLFQLFNDERLQENNFVKLMRVYLKDTLSIFNKKK